MGPRDALVRLYHNATHSLRNMLLRMSTRHESIARVEVGRRIRTAREAQGLSLRRFALMVGISYPYLSNVENGKQAPTVDMLERIARGLGMDIRDLF